MAVPRVFISSTYYDLKQVRNNIGSFIESLGYEPVMHERAEVAYSQNNALEYDCYHEVENCDIVVCIIGNHFGSQSVDTNLSITMKEVLTAIKEKKKVYIFIAKDVYIENRTYIQNKESGNFKSAYTDDIRIHEFIEQIKSNVKDHVVESFETTDEIIDTLRKQFAGLLQGLLRREASLSDHKTAYDLQQSVDSIQKSIEDFEIKQAIFFQKFDSTIYSVNNTLWTIKNILGMKKSSFYAKDIDALDEFMLVTGFVSVRVDNQPEDIRKYVRSTSQRDEIITLKKKLFTDDGKFLDIRSKEKLDEYIHVSVIEKDDGELPF